MLARTAFLCFLMVLMTLPLQAQENKKKKAPAPEFQWVNPPSDNAPKGLSHSTFRSDANNAEVGYCYILPPGYDKPRNAEKRYPVIYWLHGGRPGGENKTVAMAHPYLDAMQAKEIPEVIVVFPNGGKLSHYDTNDSKGEQAFLELVKHVDATYRTVADRSGRAVEGFSQGGRGTGRYALKHPELFCSAAPLSGGQQHEKRISENSGTESSTVTITPPTNNTFDLAKQYASNKNVPQVEFFIAVGDKDDNLEGNKLWSQTLNDLGIEHTFVIVPGVPHSAQKMYSEIGPQIMNFHIENFRKQGSLPSKKK